MKRMVAMLAVCALAAGLLWAADEVQKINPDKSGTYTSGKWTYTLEVASGGYRTEKKLGTLSYDGQELDLKAKINDFIRTPWGPMYWVGKRLMTWGPSGWMTMRHESETRQGKELMVPGLPAEEYAQLPVAVTSGEIRAVGVPAAAAAVQEPPSTGVPVPGPASSAGLTPSSGLSTLPPPGPNEIVLGREATGHYVEVAVGQTITVRLPGNPTTGFEWVALPPDDPAVTVEASGQYVADPAGAGQVGGGGTYVFHYKAERPGTAKIVLHYRRSWEKSPTEIFHVLVRVSVAAK
jgi:inhibitor of cysteine peptidase